MAVSIESPSGALQEVVSRIGSLPTLPQIALEVMSMARNEMTTMGRIASRIDRDPAISSTLLRVANSSYYGLPRAVQTTETAILVLGLKQVQNIILGVSICSAFAPVEGKPSFDREAFWRHCGATGLLARMLADKLALPVNGEEFSAGVLHDIGLIVFDQYFHENLIEAIDLTRRESLSLDEAERRIFGLSHAELGGWMLHHWRLPPSLARAAAFHDRPELAEEDRALVATVSLGNAISKLCGLGGTEGDLGVIAEHTGWKMLRDEFPQAPLGEPEALVEVLREEIEEAKRRGDLAWLKT